MRLKQVFLALKMTDDLEIALLDFVINSAPDHVDYVANKIAKSIPETLLSIAELARTAKGKVRLYKLLQAAELSDISLTEFAGILKGVALAHSRLKISAQVDLIWTGPSTNLVPTRKTEPALTQIIQSAESKLFLTSFVAYSFPSVLAALTDALTRDVEVSMLLESSQAFGGGVTFDVIGKMKADLPDAKIYSWDDKSDDYIGGKVHAKVAVADGKQCFISSANLTAHAMERNMEAGVLISGGDIPYKLHSHLEALITTRIISRVRD